MTSLITKKIRKNIRNSLKCNRLISGLACVPLVDFFSQNLSIFLDVLQTSADRDTCTRTADKLFRRQKLFECFHSSIRKA